MKQLMKIFVITLSLSFLISCSNHTQTQAINHSSPHSIIPTVSKEKAGFMQKALDGFLEDDWEPTVNSDKTIQKKYMKENTIDKNGTVQYKYKENSFTLQEYVDKTAAYIQAKPADHEHSNVHKLEQMPVIGK